MIGAAIVGAELSFWVVLAVALGCRYVLRWRGPSTVLLFCLPVIDVCLLVLVVIDLGGGTPPRQVHALAASYIGFTVAFGHPITRWADQRFAHRFAGGPRPHRPAKGSRADVRRLWIEWLRVLLAVGISEVILLALATVVTGQALPHDLEVAATNPVWAQMILLVIVAVVWFLAGPAFTRPIPPAATTRAPSHDTAPEHVRSGDRHER